MSREIFRRHKSLKHILFWLSFWLLQSWLFSRGKDFRFYLLKCVVITSFQIGLVVVNYVVLIPHLLSRSLYVGYILSSAGFIYLAYIFFFPVLDLFFAWTLGLPSASDSGVIWVTDYWSIISGSSMFTIVFICSTLYYLIQSSPPISEPEVDTYGGNPIPTIIEIKDGHITHFLPISEILYVKGMGEYVSWKTPAQCLVELRTLKSIEADFHTAGLVRVHKSYIVNRNHISSIHSNFVMVSEDKIPVGRKYKNNLKEKLEVSPLHFHSS